MFRSRDRSPEIMDDTTIEGASLNAALSELRIINKFLGGNSVTLAGLKKLFHPHLHHSLKILDAGSGGGTNFNSLAGNYKIKLFLLDKNPGACRFIKAKGKDQAAVCGDVNCLPFKEKSFDAVHSALLLHHFDEETLPGILRGYVRVSRGGVIVNDLRRSVWAYMGIKILTMLFSGSAMVKNDAPLSVKRGFRGRELHSLMKQLNIAAYTLKRKWAFRWLLVIYPNEKKL